MTRLSVVVNRWIDAHKFFVSESRHFVGPKFKWKDRLYYPIAWLRFMRYYLLVLLLSLALGGCELKQEIPQEDARTQYDVMVSTPASLNKPCSPRNHTWVKRKKDYFWTCLKCGYLGLEEIQLIKKERE